MRYITLLISASFLFFACGEEGEASIEKVDLAKVEATTGGPEIVFRRRFGISDKLKQEIRWCISMFLKTLEINL